MLGMKKAAGSGGARDAKPVCAVKIRAEDTDIPLDGLPAIRLTLALPELTDACGKTARAAGRVNAFYSHMGRAMAAHARRRMLPQAAASFRDAIAHSRPFEPYRVKMRCDAAISEDGELTVERVLYVRRGPEDERERRFVEIWDMGSGLMSRRRSEAVSQPRPARRPRRGR
jgi:hypothetical protein